jgi:hypothetical protein
MSLDQWAFLGLANMAFLTIVAWWLDDLYIPSRRRKRHRHG